MGRRRSNFDELVLLPWPVAVLVGLGAFVALRYGVAWYFASRDGAFAQAIATAAERGALASAAWMVLGVCLVAGLVSFLRARSRRRLLDQTRQLGDLRTIHWARFEQLVGEMFRRRGYCVEETGLGGADGGIDLVLRRGGAKEIVQCKQWKSAQVGVRTVREMYGLLHDSGASRAWIICCSDFTADARRFAADKPLSLITGDELLREITAVQDDPAPLPTQAPSSPVCPRCGSAMQLRTNRRNREQFWGCSGYPSCRATQAAGASAQL